MRENFRSVPSAWWWILEEQGVNFINLISDSNYFLKKSQAFNLKQPTHSEGEYLPFFLHQNNLLLWIFQGWIFHDSPVGDFMHFLCILIHLLHAYLYCIYTYLLCL